MFSYSCEKCGREVPPAYSECPDCAKSPAAPAATAVLEPEPAAPPPQPKAQVAPPPKAQPTRVPQARGGTPGWAIALLVGAVLIGGGYLFISKGLPLLRGNSGQVAFEQPPVTEATPASVSNPASAPASASSPAGAPDHARFLQVTGLRIAEVNRRPQVSMVVVNHAGAELVDIRSTVLIRTTKDRPDTPPIAKVELKLGSIGPNEVRDVTLSLPTSLRAYELPDWQFLTAEVVPTK